MYVTFVNGHRCRPGSIVCVNGGNYVVIRAESHTLLKVRRTFWQWLKDLVAQLSTSLGR